MVSLYLAHIHTYIVSLLTKLCWGWKYDPVIVWKEKYETEKKRQCLDSWVSVEMLGQGV